MTIDEVQKKIDAGTPVTQRSCWICNHAHTHLKTREILLCISCDRVFYKGKEVKK